MARRGKFIAGQPVHIVNAVGTETAASIQTIANKAGRSKGCIEVQTVGESYGPQPVLESNVLEGWVL